MIIIGYDESRLLASSGIEFGTLTELEGALRVLGTLNEEHPHEVERLIAKLRQAMKYIGSRKESSVITTPRFTHNIPNEQHEHPFVNLTVTVAHIIQKGRLAGFLLKICNEPTRDTSITTSHIEAELACRLRKPYDLLGIEMHWTIKRSTSLTPTFDVPQIVQALQSIKDTRLVADDISQIAFYGKQHNAMRFEAICQGYIITWGVFGDRPLSVPRLAITIWRTNKDEAGLRDVASSVKKAIEHL